jgi:hypothetical protein
MSSIRGGGSLERLARVSWTTTDWGGRRLRPGPAGPSFAGDTLALHQQHRLVWLARQGGMVAFDNHSQTLGRGWRRGAGKQAKKCYIRDNAGPIHEAVWKVGWRA